MSGPLFLSGGETLMAKWHYQVGTVKHGPVDSKRLKELAQNGELNRDDLVWREGLKSWVKAKKIKGLFTNSNAVDNEPPIIAPDVANPTKNPPPESGGIRSVTNGIKWLIYSWPIIALTTCCFPVSLGLIWTHPTWKVLSKILWSAACLCITAIIIS